MHLWPVEHFFPPRSVLIWKKTEEKSVQPVRGASFRSDFSSNLYFSALHIMHTWVGTKLQFQKIETLWIIIFAPFIIVHKLNATEKLIKAQEIH